MHIELCKYLIFGMKPYLSLIIPAYNEEKRIGNTLKLAIAYLDSKHFPYEIVVVDDGSKDNTIEVAKGFAPIVNVINYGGNRGKGAAVQYGMMNSIGDFKLFSDADLSTPIYESDKILKYLTNGYDVAIGSRAVDTSLVKKHQPFYREFMGKTFNKIVRALVVRGIKDTQCGFKGFSEKAANDVFSIAKIPGFGFDVEILYLAKKMGYKIAEIPVEWYNDERTTVNPIKDSLRMFQDLLIIKKLHKNSH